MAWIKIVLHFPSFFSYRIPDYSSQYALSTPLPSPSAIKLGLVATAIRTTGDTAEGKYVFYSIRDSDIQIEPPKEIVINSVLIRRLRKKEVKSKEDKEKREKGLLPAFEQTFGVREYVFFSDDLNVFISCKKPNDLIDYVRKLRYLGSGDSILYVKQIETVNKPPKTSIKAISRDEFANIVSRDYYLIYPVKDIKDDVKFEELNPYSNKKTRRKVFVTKYYLLKAQLKKGKNWRTLIIL